MAKTTYQTYTSETPIDFFRKDFIRRGAMCQALVSRFSGLEPVANESVQIVATIDERGTEIRAVEDDLVRARALEDVEKMDVVDAYTALRLMMTAYDRDRVRDFLPDAPSSLKQLGPKNLSDRVKAQIENLRILPEDSPLRTEFLPPLEREVGELETADRAEDDVRARVSALGLGLTVYKSELAQTRESQIGTIQSVLSDRAKAAQFTLPWRRSKRRPKTAVEDEGPAPTEPVEPTE